MRAPVQQNKCSNEVDMSSSDTIQPASHGSTSRLAWIILAFFLVLYLFTARGRITVIDGLARYRVTEAIALRDNVGMPEDWPHAVIGKDGARYAYYSLGQSLAALPLFVTGQFSAQLFGGDPAVASELGYSFINCFMSAGLCAVFFLLCIQLGYTRRTALWLTVILGLGTIIWSHSKDSYEHPQEALFMLAGLLMVLRALSYRKVWLFLAAGVCFGAGLLTRDSAIFFILPTAVYVAIQIVCQARQNTSDALRTGVRSVTRRVVLSLGLGLLGALPFLLLAGWYNFLRSSSPFTNGYEATGHFAAFVTPLIRGLVGLLISPARGLLEYNPILLLLFFVPSCLVLFWRRRKGLGTLFAVIIMLYIIVYAKFRYWDGGVAWGPRYLLPTIPLLLLPIGEIIEKWHIQALTRALVRVRVLFFVLLGISLLLQVTSVLVDTGIWFHEVALRNEATRKSGHGQLLAINSSLVNSPLLRQFQSVARVVDPERFGNNVSMLGEKSPDPPFATPSAFSSRLDFWWLYWPSSQAVVFRVMSAIILAGLILLFGGLLIRQNTFMAADERGSGQTQGDRNLY
jgi:hypothetical protein